MTEKELKDKIMKVPEDELRWLVFENLAFLEGMKIPDENDEKRFKLWKEL